jgi:hypothetical protein
VPKTDGECRAQGQKFKRREVLLVEQIPRVANLTEKRRAVEQVLSAYKDCARVLGRDLLAEVKCLMPASRQGV